MKWWIILLFFALSLIVVCIGYYIKPYYTAAEKQKGLSVVKHKDDTIRIAYIGDSWADAHKNVKCIIDSLVRDANKYLPEEFVKRLEKGYRLVKNK